MKTQWHCPNGCKPDFDTPFFYAPICIAHEIDGYDGGLGVLAYVNLEPSNRFVDGTVGVPKEVMKAIELMDCLPYCIECYEEVSIT